MPSSSYPRIPYGEADFKRIRLNRWLYVDKTRFVHALEEERYVFLIRPRRFGKSCWVSLLDNYYSRTRADDFEVVFGGTDLGRQPTENRHRYVILRFDFSMFDDTLQTLRERFETYCALELDHALRRNRDLFPQEARQRILSLHYFGLLSIRAVERGMPRLGIPNQTVKRLMYGYLRDAYDDVGMFSVDVYTFFRLAQAMAYDGAWQPVLDFLRDALAEQTGIRNYMDGEKVVHGFVAAHLSLSQYFLLHSEYELNKGYADLYLEPFVAQYPDMQFGYVLELKYLKRSESLDESVVADRMQEAVLQLRSYLADPSLPRRYRSVRHIGLAVVFHGWELVAYQAIDDATED